MQNFQDTFETHKRSFISAFSICMTVPLSLLLPLLCQISCLFLGNFFCQETQPYRQCISIRQYRVVLPHVIFTRGKNLNLKNFAGLK